MISRQRHRGDGFGPEADTQTGHRAQVNKPPPTALIPWINGGMAGPGQSPDCHLGKSARGTILARVHKPVLLLWLLASGWGAALAAPMAMESAVTSRVLILENSTVPLKTAKATLIVGPLTRTNGIYAGDFKVKVFPYFFKSDRGHLAINVPDAALAAINQGKSVYITGTSTSAKTGAVRHIEITATPRDCDHGIINLWFMAGGQKMIFTPAYHFADQALAATAAPAPPQTISLR